MEDLRSESPLVGYSQRTLAVAVARFDHELQHADQSVPLAPRYLVKPYPELVCNRPSDYRGDESESEEDEGGPECSSFSIAFCLFRSAETALKFPEASAIAMPMTVTIHL